MAINDPQDPNRFNKENTKYDRSKFRLVGMCTVALDKVPNQDIIYFLASELMPQEDGEIDALTKLEIDDKIVDAEGIERAAVLIRKPYLRATWFNDGDDGRVTSPDVVNGETVRIYQFANEPKYFWSTVFREPGLRRLEHVVHAYSNIPSGREAFGADSSYGSVFSTRDKIIRFWTSKSDGESVAYQLSLNPGGDTATLSDDKGNSFTINSSRNQVSMGTRQASIVITGGSIAINGAVQFNGPVSGLP